MLHDQTDAAETQCHGFLCPECSSPLIQAVEWTQLSEKLWSVVMRCPECFQSGEIVMDESQVHEFSLLADEAVRNLLELAESLDQEIFRQSCETLVQLLRADLICPMDF